MSLPKAHRLKRRQDFQEIYDRGLTRKTPHFTLRGLQEPDPTPPRIGIVVGKKTSKKAVIRNRLKRQIRAALRPLLPEMAPGWKIIIGVKAGVSECEFEHFLRELKELLTEAEVLGHGH